MRAAALESNDLPLYGSVVLPKYFVPVMFFTLQTPEYLPEAKFLIQKSPGMRLFAK